MSLLVKRKEREIGDTETIGRKPLKTKVEIRMIQLQAKEHPRLQEAKSETLNRFSLNPPEGSNLISDSWPPDLERINVCCGKPPRLC